MHGITMMVAITLIACSTPAAAGEYPYADPSSAPTAAAAPVLETAHGTFPKVDRPSLALVATAPATTPAAAPSVTSTAPASPASTASTASTAAPAPATATAPMQLCVPPAPIGSADPTVWLKWSGLALGTMLLQVGGGELAAYLAKLQPAAAAGSGSLAALNGWP